MNKVLFALGLLAFANATLFTLEANELNTGYDRGVIAREEPKYGVDKKHPWEDQHEDEDEDEHQDEDEDEYEDEDEDEDEDDHDEGEDHDEEDKFRCKWNEVAKQCNHKCYPWMIGNKKCDPACNVPKCKFDNGECKPALNPKYCYVDKHNPKKSCLWKEVGNKKCNWACFRPECNYDEGDCFFENWDCKTKFECAPGCNYKMIGNKICDWACFTKSCKFDLKDCCHSEKCDKKPITKYLLSEYSNDD